MKKKKPKHKKPKQNMGSKSAYFKIPDQKDVCYDNPTARTNSQAKLLWDKDTVVTTTYLIPWRLASGTWEGAHCLIAIMLKQVLGNEDTSQEKFWTRRHNLCPALCF